METSKIECCRIKEKANPQESWSFSSHKYILCICIFIPRFQYLLFHASGVSSWVYPSCTYLCCINNSLSLSPVYLNLQVFTPVLFCCAICLSVWLLCYSLLCHQFQVSWEKPGSWNILGMEGWVRECSSIFRCSLFTHRIALTFSSSLPRPYFWGTFGYSYMDKHLLFLNCLSLQNG